MLLGLKYRRTKNHRFYLGISAGNRATGRRGYSYSLAISLHGATNAVRDRIMPINKRYPLEVLIPVAEKFRKQHGRMLTLSLF